MSEFTTSNIEMYDGLIDAADMLQVSHDIYHPTAGKVRHMDTAPVLGSDEVLRDKLPVHLDRCKLIEVSSEELIGSLSISESGIRVGYQPLHYVLDGYGNPKLAPETAYFALYTKDESGQMEEVINLQRVPRGGIVLHRFRGYEPIKKAFLRGEQVEQSTSMEPERLLGLSRLMMRLVRHKNLGY